MLEESNKKRGMFGKQHYGKLPSTHKNLPGIQPQDKQMGGNFSRTPFVAGKKGKKLAGG